MVRFQYSLARELGKTRAELVRSMSTSEFIGWIAYFKLEQEDQKRQAEDAEDRARAQQMLARLR
jgi:hypothetical protein